MAIYLGGNNSRPYFGGVKINEAYLGSVKVLNGGMPTLAPNSLRLQFDDASYDPTVGVWSDRTILDFGWVATKRTSNIWDIRHDGESLHDTTTPFSTAGSNPPTQPWRVLEVNKNPAWNDYWALFARQPYLEYVPLFEIAGTENFGMMFYEASGLTNSVEWAKNIAAHFQGYTTEQTFTNCANASSIPFDFGGTKQRSTIVSKTGAGPFDETFSVDLHPGDWVYIACRGYSRSNKSNAYIHARTAGTEIARNISDFSSSIIMRVEATGNKGSKATGSFTCRWGYPPGSVMTCGSSRRQAYSNNNPYANVYVDSFQFL